MFLIRRDPSMTAGVGAAEMTDSERRASDLFKTGKVIETDYSDPTAPRLRVGIGDEEDQAEGYIQTGWLPLMGGRAGNGESEWDAPEVGEVVSVLSEMGEIQNGVVLPGSMYNQDNPAPSTEAGVYVRRFKTGASITYDRSTGAMALDATQAGSLTLTAGGCSITMSQNTIEVSAPGDVNFTTPKADFSGNVGPGTGKTVVVTTATGQVLHFANGILVGVS